MSATRTTPRRNLGSIGGITFASVSLPIHSQFGARMRILVTAGNTQTPLDRVRCITNIFTGQTGTRIAREAHARGHAVCLLTSHPNLADVRCNDRGRWDVRPFRTFDDLHALMAEAIPSGAFDAV